jgi:hypothetical protein
MENLFILFFIEKINNSDGMELNKPCYYPNDVWHVRFSDNCNIKIKFLIINL